MAAILSLAAFRPAHAQAPATAGTIFQVSQRAEVAYIVASMHGTSPVPVVLSPRVSEAIAWADVVAFEAVPGNRIRDARERAEVRQVIRRTRDRAPLDEVLPADLALRMWRVLERRGVGETQWQRLLDTKIEFAAGVLEDLAGTLQPFPDREGWNHPGIDMLVHDQAVRKGRHIEELESNVRLLRNRFTLTLEESVAQLARVVERLERDSAYEANDAQSSRGVRLLLSGKVDAAYDAFRTQVCGGATLGAACDKMVEGRNGYLATRIDQLFQSGQKVVAVVGAAHVAGPRSVLAELRARGYTVRDLSPRP
jgi:uncharacterized protein YbaP (TraB family)